MGKLEGKVAVITGGNSGIGLGTAQRFVAEGAYVYITGRRQKELDEAVQHIGNNVTGVQSDVSNLADLDRLYETVKQKHGHFDILFANAGVGEFLPLGEITEEHFDKTFNTNVKGLVFTVQKALPLLRDGGSIILNASSSWSQGAPSFSIYSASNAAIRALARNWILDVKGRNLRINAISPGPTDTPGLHGLTDSDEQFQQLRAHFQEIVPLGRMAKPEEIAKAVVFLASDDSSFVNGIDLPVDGGEAQV